MMSDDHQPAGNIYNKIGTKNPLAKALLTGYFRELDRFLRRIQPRRLLEVGCGEGYILRHIKQQLPAVNMHGIDVSSEILLLAKDHSGGGEYACASAYDLPFPNDEYKLVLCVEVLEHLDRPEIALKEIRRVSSKHVLISVPLEPIWRMLNILRGAYVRRLGNTPGHLQHWTKGSLTQLLQTYFAVIDIKIAFPWIMALCEVRSGAHHDE
jgi:ubiquinone/menaquinone biosynthesis C-methylase UbiE